jgi:hypothetical protein
VPEKREWSKSKRTGHLFDEIFFDGQAVPVDSNISGARKLSQLQDNLASFNVALSAEQVKALDLRAIRSSIQRCEPRYQRSLGVRPCGPPLTSGTSSPSAVARSI